MTNTVGPDDEGMIVFDDDQACVRRFLEDEVFDFCTTHNRAFLPNEERCRKFDEA